MDGNAQAQQQGYGVIGGVAPPTDRPPTQMDHIKRETERALSRANIIAQRMISIGERLVGPVPETTLARDQAANAINQAGFIPSTNISLERLHNELARIEELVAGFDQTV